MRRKMKSMIKFARSIHPFIFMPVLFVITYFFFGVINPLDKEQVLAIILVEALTILGGMLILNWLTQGKYMKDSQEGWYLSQVGVSYFGERIRWSGYFKYKYTAVFSAMYKAWVLDHFGDVSSACGINYYVNQVGNEKK